MSEQSSPHGAMSRLRRSTLPLFHGIQRAASRVVWGAWILWFLFWELSGTLRWTPWRTLSETAWDVELEYPGTRKYLEDFLLGLAIHIRSRTTLESSIDFAVEIRSDFNEYLRGHDYI